MNDPEATADDPVVVGWLWEAGERRERCAAAVHGVMVILAQWQLAERPNNGELLDDAAQHAFVALDARLGRERNGEMGDDRDRYAHLPVHSPDFHGVARRFVSNALRDLGRRE